MAARWDSVRPVSPVKAVNNVTLVGAKELEPRDTIEAIHVHVGEPLPEATGEPGGPGNLVRLAQAVERHYRDIRILGIGGGTNEIMKEIISKRLGL